MSLEKQDIEKIAHLARLKIEEDAIPHYAKDLNNILDLVAQMSEVDTQDIQPMAHPLDAHQRLRPDTVSEANKRDVFQAIAPKTEAGVYLVPKVIE